MKYLYFFGIINGNMLPKRLVIILLLSVATSSMYQGELYAAPSNGTRFPSKGSLEAGYEYNVILRRSIERSYGNLKSGNHFYTVSMGIYDWLSFDGKAGVGTVIQKGGGHLPKIDYNAGFAGGYGFRIKAFDDEKRGIRVILGAQHICVHPQVRSIDDDKYESILDDWQVSGLVSKSFKFLTTYAGIKGSDCEIIYNINNHDKKRRYSRYHIGLITGLELYLFNDKIRANIEARFFDETAFSTAVCYLF
ncbi:MAG: hypothetical protein JSV93_02375 [Candidatus Omnitrophota bacterium]|nr:MAG: hypothetical protein JSV93_02375 [Candidatus Omnitrophota bacterium]